MNTKVEETLSWKLVVSGSALSFPEVEIGTNYIK